MGQVDGGYAPCQIHVLLIAPPRRAGVLHARLGRTGFVFATAPEVAQGLVYARQHRPQVIVLMTSATEEETDSLGYLLKTAPETSHVPLVLLTEAGALVEVVLERRSGGGTLCSYFPFSSRDIGCVIRQLVADH